MTPREAVNKLIDAEYPQPVIVEMLGEMGIKTTQATVSRIATGSIQNTNFEVGSALIALCEQRLPKKPKKRVA